MNDQEKLWFDKGFAAARERARGIAEDCRDNHIVTGSELYSEIVDRIAAMEPEGK